MLICRYLLPLVLIPRLIFAFSTTVSASSAILVNAETGAVLFAKEPHAQHFPASTMKMATALYALSKASEKLDEMVVADAESLTKVSPKAKVEAGYDLPAYWLETDAKLLGIKRGEQFRLEDLLYGTLVGSGGDSANLIAKHVGGSIMGFMDGLNTFVRELGCKETHFMNPSGLHHPDQKTSAYDLALIAREAIKIQKFRQIVSAKEYNLAATKTHQAWRLVQTNKLLRSGKENYSLAIGVKTGWTSAAKSTFVAAAESKGRRLIAVLLRSIKREDMFADAKRLFEKAFAENLLEKELFAVGPQKIYQDIDGAELPLQAALKSSLVVTYYESEKPDLKAKIHWNSLSLPIEEGTKVGELVITADNQEYVRREPLYAAKRVRANLWMRSRMPALFLVCLGSGFLFLRFRSNRFG